MNLANIKSIQSKMILALILFMVVPMTLLSFASFRSTERIVSQKVEESTFNTLEQLNSNFQRIIDNMMVITNVIEMDREFLKSLNVQHFRNEYEYFRNYKKISDRLASSLGIILRYNCQVAFIGMDGKLYDTWESSITPSGEELLSAGWYREAVKRDGGYLWLAPQKNYIPEEQDSGRDLISLAKLVKGETQIRGYGVLLVSLYIDEIEKGLNASVLPEKEGFFIINDAGEIILKTNFAGGKPLTNFKWCAAQIRSGSQGHFSGIYQGQKTEVFYKELKNTGWKSVYVISDAEMLKEVKKLGHRDFFFTLLIMALFTTVTIFIAYTITKPLKLLGKRIRKIKSGDWDMELPVTARDEIGRLTEDFNRMLQDIRLLMNEVTQKEKEKKEAHLMALQAQINPHFLFNTLNAIKWTAYVNGVNNIGDMIASLGRLFEIAISKKSEYILIKEEVDYLQNYLNLMSLRYNQNFTLEYDLEPSVMELYTLKFILQPLVENAIIHGLDSGITEGKLKISGKRDGNVVLFTVSDNGKGIPAKKIALLLNAERNSDSRRFSSIGLSNVNERIKLNFGEVYGLEIQSIEQKGTEVLVRIPVVDRSPEGSD